MSLPILFFITLIAVVILTLMLVEKNNNMTRLENEAESLKKHLCDLEIQKSKFLKELKKDKDKLQEELCVVKKELEEKRKEYFRELEALNPNRSLEKVSCHFLMTAIRKTALYMLDS